MTTYLFAPSPTAPFQFQPTLDGEVYHVVVTWNLFGQRYYVNVMTTSGALVYVAGNRLSASTLAELLRRAGSIRAMELDINPAWVQLAYAGAPGAPLTAGIPGTHRPANQYQQGWTRDFVTVLAAR